MHRQEMRRMRQELVDLSSFKACSASSIHGVRLMFISPGEQDSARERADRAQTRSFGTEKSVRLALSAHGQFNSPRSHDVEVSDLKRDFDFKYAAVRIQCDRKVRAAHPFALLITK